MLLLLCCLDSIHCTALQVFVEGVASGASCTGTNRQMRGLSPVMFVDRRREGAKGVSKRLSFHGGAVQVVLGKGSPSLPAFSWDGCLLSFPPQRHHLAPSLAGYASFRPRSCWHHWWEVHCQLHKQGPPSDRNSRSRSCCTKGTKSSNQRKD